MVNVTLMRLVAASALAALTEATAIAPVRRQSQCPGYTASNVVNGVGVTTADLKLAGDACNVYGTDLGNLKLLVEYQTAQRLHVKIYDSEEQVYQIAESVIPRPESHKFTINQSDLIFALTESPFSFKIRRRSTNETLFDTAGNPLIFESQYLNLRTKLPDEPNLYGLGETTDDMRLPTSNYTRTLWSRDAPGTPQNSNLYGNHPIYYDHRSNGTHGVFLLNSNGMDIKINKDASGQYLEYNTLGGVMDLYFLSGPDPKAVAKQYSEVVGKPAMHSYWHFGFHNLRYGYQDIYEVAETIANYSAKSLPLECQWTDIDYMDRRKVFSTDPYRYNISLVRELVDTLHKNDQHYVVMVDPAVAYQHYPAFDEGVTKGAFLKTNNGSVYKGIVWPGVTAFPDWFAPNTQDYWSGQFDSFFSPDSGIDIDALWIDMNEASNFQTWDSITSCGEACDDPELYANRTGNPPRRSPARIGAPRPIEGFGPDFQPQCKVTVSFNVAADNGAREGLLILGNTATLGDSKIDYAPPLSHVGNKWNVQVELPAHGLFTYQYVRVIDEHLFSYESEVRNISTGECGAKQTTNDTITTSPISQRKRSPPATVSVRTTHSSNHAKRQDGSKLGLPGRDLLNPKYQIANTYGPALSNKTLQTDIIQANGASVYDQHNLYGLMMSIASRKAMLSRRPNSRPLIITRSTFAGAGAHVGHWTGDNLATWEQYRFSIQQIQEFASFFQVPMVGADICGFNPPDTTETLCARWVFMGAFSPFFRDHSADNAMPHPLYYSDFVAKAARVAIDVRYRLLDYAYTAFYRQTTTGNPWINPMFFMYPKDEKTLDVQWQFFYGESILVAPVTQENSTEVTFYLPDDQFYNFWTYEPVKGTGTNITVSDVGFDTIPLYFRGGSIVPMRTEGAMTTTALRKKNFNVVIAPAANGTAKGSLYLDDGDSLKQAATSEIEFAFSGGVFNMSGTFGYDVGNVVIENIVLLGQSAAGNGGSFNESSKAATWKVDAGLKQAFSKRLV